jgi:hypothetical protein
MAASELDVFEKQGISTVTTLSAPGKAAAATTITVGSTVNFPTTTGITFAIRTVDSSGELVAGTYTEWVGTVTSGTTLAMNAVPVYGSDQVYTAGSTTQVYIPVSSYSYNKMIDGLLAEHNQLDGTHKAALITSRTEDTSPDVGADFLLAYDTSATALKKVKPSNLGITTGLVAGQLPAVSSVTNNGNGSNDITFASTVANILTPGMRVRTTRTVAAPTGAISLNGTTQYASKTTPTGVGATDDYTIMGWIRPTAYQNGWILSKLNAGGNSGKGFQLNASGQLGGGSYNVAPTTRLGTSYQSVPLNKWSHVAISVDASAGSLLIYINGILVPSATTGAAVAATDAGNLEVGSYGGGLQPFAGNLSQVAMFSSVLSAATIRSYASQTLSGSESTCVAAFKLDQASGLNDLTANANNLTATGSPTYSVASPFTTDANGVSAGTYDWGIVTKVATTVATVQVPEGSCLPTSGGITTVDYSGVKAPFGMPVSEDRYAVESIYQATMTKASPTTSVSYNNGEQITVPTGSWKVSAKLLGYVLSGTAGSQTLKADLNTTTATVTITSRYALSGYVNNITESGHPLTLPPTGLSVTSQTVYYLNVNGSFAGVGTNVGFLHGFAGGKITLIPDYL